MIEILVGLVAQSVEQRTENPCVAGSIPARATNKSTSRTCFFDSLFMTTAVP